MKSNVRTMDFIGLDDWHRPVYKCIESGSLWKDLSQDEENPELYNSSDNTMDGEPDCPIKKELEIKYNSKYKKNPYEFSYQMLSRLKSDCDYYLGYGNRCTDHLYYKDEQRHIDEMKNLYNIFPDNKKPEWLTWEQLLQYEKDIVGS